MLRFAFFKFDNSADIILHTLLLCIHYYYEVIEIYLQFATMLWSQKADLHFKLFIWNLWRNFLLSLAVFTVCVRSPKTWDLLLLKLLDIILNFIYHGPLSDPLLYSSRWSNAQVSLTYFTLCAFSAKRSKRSRSRPRLFPFHLP